MPKLELTADEGYLLAGLLNNARLSNFTLKQRDLLPDLGRKLSGYLAELPQKPGPKRGMKRKKKLVGFAATKATNTEMHSRYLKLVDASKLLPDV